jgi:hypothetical protein
VNGYRREPTPTEKKKLDISLAQELTVYFLTLTVDEYTWPEPVGKKSEVRSINEIEAILDNRKKLVLRDILLCGALEERSKNHNKFHFRFQPVETNNLVSVLLSESSLILERPHSRVLAKGRPRQNE